MKSAYSFLNRFTTLPFLIDMLISNRLTLLNPVSWEDHNDRVTMELYKEEMRAKAIYALCLTNNRETIHHWNTFADGTSGCCIEFDFNRLIDTVKTFPGLSHGEVHYVKINSLSNEVFGTDRLPYLKRQLFYPENEYRIVVTNNDEQNATLDIPIDEGCIRRITFSNKLPVNVLENIRQTINCIKPGFKGRISHSTLFNNAKWTNYFTKRNSK